MEGWDSTLTDLRNTLAYLYDNGVSARTVAVTAGIDPAEITVQGSAVEIWQGILERADKNDQVEAILAVAKGEYGGNRRLAAAADAYVAARGGQAQETHSGGSQDGGQRTEIKVEIGVGENKGGIVKGVSFGEDFEQRRRYEQYTTALNWEAAGKPRMRGYDLSKTDLAGISLAGADLRTTNLREAKLDGANFEDANLSHVKFGKANLAYANLRTADLHGADLSEAILKGADLRGANLFEAVLAGAQYTADTKWPDDFDPTAAGAIFKESL